MNLKPSSIGFRPVVAFLLAFIASFTSACIVVPGASSNKTHGTTLYFPAEQSAGTIFLRPRKSPWNMPWTEFGPARGDTLIPEDMEVKLDISTGNGALNPLIHLNPGELAAFRAYPCRSDDNMLSSVARFKSLRELNIQSNLISDSGIAQIRDLRHLQILELWWCRNLTDNALASLQNIRDLRLLNLVGAKITDLGAKHLRNMRSLQVLWISETEAGDEFLKSLSSIHSLEELYARNTKISDGSVNQLGRMTSLKRLDISGSRVTPDGVHRLRSLLPSCVIICDSIPIEK